MFKKSPPKPKKDAKDIEIKEMEITFTAQCNFKSRS